MTDDGVPARRDDICIFFVLACGITWALDLPLALAWARNTTPPACAMPMVGFGALGPSVAAFMIAAQRRELRDVFGRGRTKPIWIVLGLLLPIVNGHQELTHLGHEELTHPGVPGRVALTQ